MAGEFYEEDKWVKEKLKEIKAALEGGSSGLDALKALILEIQANILALLNNGSYGLAALRALIIIIDSVVDAIEDKLDDGTTGLAALKALVDAVDSTLDDGTHGLAALKTLIDAVEAKLDDGTHGLAALKALIDAVEGKLDSGTYGLAALKALIDTVDTAVDNLVMAAPDGVHVDSVLGVSGTPYPIGTPGKPVSNLADALTIAATMKVRKIYLHGQGTYSLPADLADYYTFIGDSREFTVLHLNSKRANALVAINLRVTGNNADATMLTIIDCNFTAPVTALEAFNCAIEGTSLVLNNFSEIYKAEAKPGSQISITGTGTYNLVRISGETTLAAVANALTIANIYGTGLKLTIDASCTAGTINIYGDVKIINNSGGATVNDYTLEKSLADIKTQTDKSPNVQHEVEWSTTPVVQQVASVNPTNLTAGSVTPTFPTGATKVRALLIASIKSANQAANTHHVSLKVQGQKAAGGYADLIDLTAQTTLGLVNLDGAGDGWVGSVDVTALVDTSAVQYDFRFVVDSDNAGAVNYTTSFVLVLVYRIP